MSNQPSDRDLSGTEAHEPGEAKAADRTAEIPELNATGAFLPGTTDGPATEAGAPEGTGVYVPQDTGATGEFRPDHGATGEYAPAPTGPPGAPSHTALTGATGAYDPSAPSVFNTAGGARAPAIGEDHCGRYVLKRFHAKGGMGEIWLAEDPEIGRPVALKRMLGRRADQQRRFRVEAQVTGQLEHPGIVPIHELGSNDDGLPFYAMKFVHGRTLQKVIREFHKTKANTGAAEVEEFRLLQIFISLCQTVAYAHSKGVLHRDLKPENVMLGQYGETLLLDWGIAKVKGKPDDAPAGDAEFVKLESGSDTETQAGSIMGSPTYMSPEVAAGLNQEVDERSDVYLLGATLYEILTGKMPREGKSMGDLIARAQKELPVAPRKVRPQVSKAMEAICIKAMALRKEDRYQTALALAEDVQRYVAGEPVTAFREGLGARVWRWAKRHRTALARVGVALVVAAAAWVGVDQYQKAEQRHQDAIQRANEQREQDRIEAEKKHAEDERLRIASDREKERLQRLNEAKADVATIRQKADEARYFAANSDAVSESSPYFDAREGEARASEALTLAAKWGTALDQLPPELTKDRDALRNNLYDLFVLLAQSRGRQGTPKAAEEALALLAEATRQREPSYSFYRVRADLHQLAGDGKKAEEDRHKADTVRTADTAQDQFLRGEEIRTQAARRRVDERQRTNWQSNPERLQRAIAAYLDAVRLDPEHYWAHFQLGRCYLSLERTADALGELGACVALQPKAPWGYSARGAALVAHGDYDDALRDLDEALRLRPDFRPARLQRGIAHLKRGRYDEALAEFNAVLEPPDGSRLIEAAFYRGQVYLQREKPVFALGALGGLPFGATAYVVDRRRAQAEFDLVVKERPRLRPVYQYRAKIFLAEGKTALGLEDLDAYLAGRDGYDPKSPMAHGLRGRELRFLYAEIPPARRGLDSSLDLAEQTLAELNEAIRLKADTADVYEDLGAMLELTRKPREAVDAYGKGLVIAPGDVKLLVKRGWAYVLYLDDKDRGLADFVAATRTDANHAEAHSGVGYVRALQGMAAEAQREADLALLRGADDYAVLHNVACIYMELKGKANEDAAVLILRRAVELWRKGVWKHDGPPLNEIDLIYGDPTFKPLADRRDFQDLLREPPKPGLGLIGGWLSTVPVRKKEL